MSLTDKEFKLLFHIIFAILVILMLLIIIFKVSPSATKIIYDNILGKITNKIFWLYVSIFSLLTYGVYNDIFMKHVTEENKINYRHAIKLGWLIAFVAFFSHVGFTISLGILASFLYIFFKIDL